MGVTLIIDDCAGCCKNCAQAVGIDLDAIFSSVALCAGCYPHTFGPGVTRDVDFSWTPINGAHVIPWTGSAWFNAMIGTMTVNRYASTDGTCTTLEDTQVADISVLIQCQPDGFSIQTNAAVSFHIGIDDFTLDVSTFSASGGNFKLDEAIPNDPARVCGVGGFTDIIGATGGTLTLSLP